MGEIRADFSRTCAGCASVVEEPWGKGKMGYRCGHDGPCRGYMVGVGRFNPYIPAWCPLLRQEGDKINERESMKRKKELP